MQKMNEKVLSSWLKMILAVDSERVASQLSYNEAVVCNVLYTNENEEMTATDLCGITKMQKSLMNRTLTSLESKQIVERTRSLKDKRLIVIKLIKDVNNLYMIQHQKTLDYVDKIVNRLGKDKIEEIVNTFQ